MKFWWDFDRYEWPIGVWAEVWRDDLTPPWSFSFKIAFIVHAGVQLWHDVRAPIDYSFAYLAEPESAALDVKEETK